MSSVVEKHALILALAGGISVAALFVWYINRKKDPSVRDLVKQHEQNNGTTQKASTAENGSVKNKLNGHANGGVVSSSNQQQAIQEESAENSDENDYSSSENEKQSESVVPTKDEDEREEEQGETEETEEAEETDHVAAGDRVEVEVEKEEPKVEQKEIDVPKEKEQESVEQEEIAVKKVEPKLKSAPTLPITMPTKSKVLDQEQIPEEPTPTKNLDATSPLSLDITGQYLQSPAAFSWSEEMERSYMEDEIHQMDNSDAERPQPSPQPTTHRVSQKNQKKTKNTGGKGGKSGRGSGNDRRQPQSSSQQQHKESAPLKKGQRRLTKEKSADEPHQQEKPQKRVVLKHQEAAAPSTDTSLNQTIDIPVHPEDESYEKSGSPGLDSQNSEASSQDSGRATGPLTSPHDENGLTGTDEDYLPMYEFEIPNSLVGLIIGVKGKTIKELSQRTNVRMLIRQHHAPEKSKTHQICQVRGKRDEINHSLQMLRRRFPPARFPELNLQPVVPPVLPNTNFDMLTTQPTWLTLPEEIKCEVAISSIISPSHFFIQQPTHASFASLRHLDMYMGQLYGEQSNLPELPMPTQNGLLCAAPVQGAWVRAVTVQYFEDTDEVFIKFVDYGGYSKIARQELRQIRTDLMSLPFQSTEVMLAHVRPVDGTMVWSEGAMEKFRQYMTGKVINCKLVGYSVESRMPMVEAYVIVKNAENKDVEVRFDQLLMESGLARTADPSKMTRTGYHPTLLMANGSATNGGAGDMKRPSFSSQTSQNTAQAVC
ncbi:unnamed protein product [Caenorhabditis brenneri]